MRNTHRNVQAVGRVTRLFYPKSGVPLVFGWATEECLPSTEVWVYKRRRTAMASMLPDKWVEHGG